MKRVPRRNMVIVAVFFAWVLSVVGGVAYGACGSSVSSCKSCHEIQKQKPVANQGQWHIDHAQLDACDYCHAGQPFATDKARAHQGMVDPFSDLQFNCGSCHPSDWQQKAASYGAK